jgi:hypothetical protein
VVGIDMIRNNRIDVKSVKEGFEAMMEKGEDSK